MIRTGKLVFTKRSGHGYVFDDEVNGSKTVRVRLLDADFKLTGKTLRTRPETLVVFGRFEAPSHS